MNKTGEHSCEVCAEATIFGRFTMERGWEWYCSKHMPKSNSAYSAKFAKEAGSWK